LKKAEEEKTKQILITTHDLKAPFVGIESNISVLKYIHWEELTPECRDIIDKIEVRSKTLRERIKQILDLGNLRTQFQNDVQTEQISLKKIFEEILDEMVDMINEKKIKLVTTILDITVNSNKNNLLILFSNLISNAIFYTQNGETIQINMEKQESEVIIKISDTGIGIAEKHLDKIFDEYFRTPEAARFNKMSTGLGLQIVKTITEKLDLSLMVESEINKGTTFTVGIRI
jgi:signal transduction histidine kinase